MDYLLEMEKLPKQDLITFLHICRCIALVMAVDSTRFLEGLLCSNLATNG